MVIILIRRFVRADREKEFLASYDSQKPSASDPAFKGETLTKINDDLEIPAGLRSLALGSPSWVTYMNIAKWDSWEAFASQFDVNGTNFDPETEAAPRQRAVLEII